MVIIDFYPENNQSTESTIKSVHPSLTANVSAVGQALVITPEKIMNIETVRFLLKRGGNATGNLVAQIYSVTGTVGTNAKPIGSPLAESSPVSMSTIPPAYQLIPFTFSPSYHLVNGVNYIIQCVAKNATLLDAGNYIFIGQDTTAPTHPGNMSYYNNGTWSGVSSFDLIFYAETSFNPGEFGPLAPTPTVSTKFMRLLIAWLNAKTRLKQRITLKIVDED